jgi:hypothetical protein
MSGPTNMQIQYEIGPVKSLKRLNDLTDLKTEWRK